LGTKFICESKSIFFFLKNLEKEELFKGRDRRVEEMLFSQQQALAKKI
jgi:hypothetical protein